MNYVKNTLEVLHDLQKDKNFKKWSNAVKEGKINHFSDDLNHVLARLAGVLVNEFELDLSNKDKVIKILELAAVAGDTL